uniref:Uncharacterized protein n=1 Tax=Manihot esculenta TaxID=3983 RepID=A0A2C9UKN2_MANES
MMDFRWSCSFFTNFVPGIDPPLFNCFRSSAMAVGLRCNCVLKAFFLGWSPISLGLDMYGTIIFGP